MKRLLLTLFLTLAATAFVAPHAAADDKPLRPVESMFMLSGGSAMLADTYLSPLRYNGWGVGFAYSRTRAMRFSPEIWVMEMALDVDYDHTQNPVRNATMHNAEFGVAWGMMRRYRTAPGLSLGIGPRLSLHCGALMNSRNGNNPVSAKASLTADIAGYASFQTRIAGVDVRFRNLASVSGFGTFFSPDYGELYYEIWLGNRKGLVHPAWWGNYVRFDNLLTADLRLGTTILRIGYKLDVASTHVNNLTSRRITHMGVVGIGCDWLSISGRGTASQRMIMANY